jgi:Holliday junction resolvase RusA-like endonuclease
MTSFVVPWGTVPKPRPIVTSRGTFMPKGYTAFKADVAEFIQLKHLDVGHDGPLICEFEFDTDRTYVTVKTIPTGYARAVHVKGDIDNLQGGIMDAMEDGGVFLNDRQVMKSTGTIRRRRS